MSADVTELTLGQKRSDRGWNGESLDHPDGYNPWKVAIGAMCDHWSEGDGMAEVVAHARRRGQ